MLFIPGETDPPNRRFGRRGSRRLCRDYSIDSSETASTKDNDYLSVASDERNDTATEHREGKPQELDSGFRGDTESEPDLIEDVPATVEVKRIIHWAVESAFEDRVIQVPTFSKQTHSSAFSECSKIQGTQTKNQDTNSTQLKTDGGADENREADAGTEMDYFASRPNPNTDENRQAAPANPDQPEAEGGAQDTATTSVAGGDDPSQPPSYKSAPEAGNGSPKEIQPQTEAVRRDGWRQRRKQGLKRFKEGCKNCCCLSAADFEPSVPAGRNIRI